MKWALIDSNNMVKNCIVYDGIANFKPPEDQYLLEINDWVEIGQDKDIPKPIFCPITPNNP